MARLCNVQMQCRLADCFASFEFHFFVFAVSRLLQLFLTSHKIARQSASAAQRSAVNLRFTRTNTKTSIECDFTSLRVHVVCCRVVCYQVVCCRNNAGKRKTQLMFSHLPLKHDRRVRVERPTTIPHEFPSCENLA
jgi:hypothetical protein